MSYLCQECKKIGSHRLRFRVKTCGIKKLARVIQHGLRVFVVKNIQDESEEENDLSHIL